MSDINEFSELLNEIRSEMDIRLKNLDVPSEPFYLYEPIKYVLKGKGKRLRPILVNLSGRGFDADSEDILHAAIAVELLHNFTLVHDDIMDNDDTRHGMPSVHHKWNESSAILAGDCIFSLGQLMVGQVKTNTIRAMKAYTKTSLTVCEGQALDLQFEMETTVSLDEYMDMISRKTGALLSLCAELGGIISNQSDEVLFSLRDYGLNLGKAFQVQDDILEIFSDSEKMGKSLGSDVIAGKQTVLTILAQDKPGWDDVFSEKIPINEKLTKMRKFFVETKVKNDADSIAENFIKKATNSLEIFPNQHKSVMKQFTHYVLKRES